MFLEMSKVAIARKCTNQKFISAPLRSVLFFWLIAKEKDFCSFRNTKNVESESGVEVCDHISMLQSRQGQRPHLFFYQDCMLIDIKCCHHYLLFFTITKLPHGSLDALLLLENLINVFLSTKQMLATSFYSTLKENKKSGWKLLPHHSNNSNCNLFPDF